MLSSSISKSTMNQLLKIEEIQNIVWKNLNISTNITLPDFPNQLLYGAVSEIIHFPDVDRVLVSNMQTESFKAFFRYLAEKYDRDYEEFDEDAANADWALTDSDDDLSVT